MKEYENYSDQYFGRTLAVLDEPCQPSPSSDLFSTGNQSLPLFTPTGSLEWSDKSCSRRRRGVAQALSADRQVTSPLQVTPLRSDHFAFSGSECS